MVILIYHVSCLLLTVRILPHSLPILRVTLGVYAEVVPVTGVSSNLVTLLFLGCKGGDEGAHNLYMPVSKVAITQQHLQHPACGIKVEVMMVFLPYFQGKVFCVEELLGNLGPAGRAKAVPIL